MYTRNTSTFDRFHTCGIVSKVHIALFLFPLSHRLPNSSVPGIRTLSMGDAFSSMVSKYTVMRSVGGVAK